MDDKRFKNTQDKCKDFKLNTKGFCVYGRFTEGWCQCHVKKFTGFIACPYLWLKDDLCKYF